MVSNAADGSPFNGTISFLPSGANNGPVANAVVENGKFLFDRETGPVGGEYRVLIRAPSEGKEVHRDSSKQAKPGEKLRRSPKKKDWEFLEVLVTDPQTPYDFKLE